MEQMEVLLNVPAISKTTVSSTLKTAVTDDDKSFADLYERNINESKSSNTETTQKSSKKTNESVDDSAKSETKAENKTDENTTAKTETAEENTDKNVVAVNWLNVLDLAADSTNEENAENVAETEAALPGDGASKAAVTSAETQSMPEISSESEIEGEMVSNVQSETMALTENTTEKATVESNSASEVVSTPAATVLTQVSETNVVGLAKETNENEVVVNQTQNEVVTQTANVVAKQTTETTSVSSDFSTMMSDDIPQSRLQKSVMSQIENSLGKIVKTGNNEIRIQLEPEQLGVLNIRVIAGKDGTQVVFKADSHQSSQLIAGQTETLKAMLNEAGIKVDQIVVNDFSFSQENYQDQQTFEQQNGKSSKYYKGTSDTDVQLETYDAGYDTTQTIVGLNYLI